VIGEADRRIRLSVFDWLTDQRAEHGEAIPRTVLERFELAGEHIPLVGPSGIWKPAACELPISIATTTSGPYSDRFDSQRRGPLRLQGHRPSTDQQPVLR
jgi:hypothetical protein